MADTTAIAVEQHGDDGDFGHHLERALARSNAGRTVRKMMRTASQKGAPDHDEATDGGGAATALMAEHATVHGEQRGRLGTVAQLTVSV